MASRVRDSIPERVAPTQRDGSESEISHTFPVPERFPGIRITLAPSENFPLAPSLRSPFPPTFLSSHTVTEEELRELLPNCEEIVLQKADKDLDELQFF